MNNYTQNELQTLHFFVKKESQFCKVTKGSASFRFVTTVSLDSDQIHVETRYSRGGRCTLVVTPKPYVQVSKLSRRHGML